MARRRRSERYLISAPDLMRTIDLMTDGVCEADRQALFCIVQGAVDELIAENIVRQRAGREELRSWQKDIILAGAPARLLIFDCCNRDKITGCRLYSVAANRVNPYGLACARHGKPLERGEVPWMDRRGKKEENNGPCAGQIDFWGNIVGE